jgi:hypothetical protein
LLPQLGNSQTPGRKKKDEDREWSSKKSKNASCISEHNTILEEKKANGTENGEVDFARDGMMLHGKEGMRDDAPWKRGNEGRCSMEKRAPLNVVVSSKRTS